jgi:hypothetical protein
MARQYQEQYQRVEQTNGQKNKQTNETRQQDKADRMQLNHTGRQRQQDKTIRHKATIQEIKRQFKTRQGDVDIHRQGRQPGKDEAKDRRR